MEFLIFIKEFGKKGIIWGTVIYFGLLQMNETQLQEYIKTMYQQKHLFLSAFAPDRQISISHTSSSIKDSLHYTTQLCTMRHPISNQFMNSNSKIQLIQRGNLYRYIFSAYSSLVKAREKLKQIRKIYPQAYIREYHQGKSGGAIDMNIDHIRIKNQIYDER